MNMKNEALLLVEQHGFCIFPVSHPGMGGPSAGKRPLIKGWQNLATTDPSTIEEWWGRWPEANIGVATGEKYDLAVLDVDVSSGGMESLVSLNKRVGEALETPLMALTGSFGLHLYFRHPPGGLVKNSASKLGPGLDIRGKGGQVVAPPSLHPSGRRYEWLNKKN